MRISRIARIKRNRVFRDFSWPNELPNFSRFNVIYGWNGSGKTTISTLFERLQERQPLSDGEVDFMFDNKTTISSSDIPDAVIPSVRVFNRDFVAKTVEAFGKRNVQPIYYLGKENIEKQNRIEGLRVELEKANGELSHAISEKEKADRAIDSFCIEKGRLIKESLFGSPEHRFYDKSGFRQTVEQLKSVSPQQIALTDEEKERLRKQKDSQEKTNIGLINALTVDLNKLRSRVSVLLEQSIVSHVLDELKSNSTVAIWVQQGLPLHKGDYQSDTCRFCGNEFSAARRTELEGHFNDAFESFQREVDQLISEIKGYRDTVSLMPLPPVALFYEHLSQDASSALAAVGPAVDAVVEIIASYESALKQKKITPFQAQTLKTQEPGETEVSRVLQYTIDEINRVINAHKEVTDNLKERVRDASQKLELDYVLEATPRFNELNEAISDATEAHETTKGKLVDLNQQIKDIESEIVEHLRPAEELTRELRTYLGRDELKFEIESTGYSLTRGGKPALQLSEGERTAIAFLYFLKSLLDKDFYISKGVVVIDDPVSSLDANALFSAFSYMKDRTSDCHQLFILTHNFMFFRQVKNWFHNLNDKKKKKIEQRPARFYMLSTEIVHGERNAVIAPLDNLLEEFESEYHYLFKQVYDAAHDPSKDSDLAQYYGMPNIGRRMIETFLAYRFPDCRGVLYKRFERVDFDTAKKTRILRFLNTYSHSGGIEEPEHDPSILSETKQVMLELLELISVVDEDHYQGMMMLLQPPEEVA